MNINRKQVLEINLALVVVSIIFHFITGSDVFIYIAGGLGLVTLFIDPLARLVTLLWMWFGRLMGGILSYIVLTMIFIFILTPVAVLFKLTGRSKKAFDETTYFSLRNGKIKPGDFENPW
ncbi:MAG: hypothetical protein JXR52_13090 [Bacteroidales bacterium]|nr:hypothetical protein [Bacteroidales bacterium]MBN2699755.1 hypothetical protein [Bacteroidales bacterium]